MIGTLPTKVYVHFIFDYCVSDSSSSTNMSNWDDVVVVIRYLFVDQIIPAIFLESVPLLVEELLDTRGLDYAW